MEPAAKNANVLLRGARSDLYLRSVSELVDADEWSELNDRFYQTLAFGTGGLRGRTIGKIITGAEQGNALEGERPEFPCVGTNAMNFFNISRATQGLVAYLHDWPPRTRISVKPKIVIAHDPRFFSREFADLAAQDCIRKRLRRICIRRAAVRFRNFLLRFVISGQMPAS